MKKPISFINSLKTISEKCSDNSAFYIDGKTFSYGEFYQKVNDIANELVNSTTAQKKVIIITNNDIETYASIIAIWLTGNVYVPLSIEEDNDRLRSVINIIDADIVLSSTTIKSDYFDGLTVVNTDELVRSTDVLPTLEINPNDIAYILFTSGTTGIPKGVPISYQNLDGFVDSFLSLDYSITSDDNFLQMAELTFDMFIISTLIPLCLGASITTIGNEEIKYLETYKALLEQNISVLVTAPSTLQLLEPYYSEINLENLRYTFVGAEAFYESTAQHWQQCAPNSNIVNLYGPSEGGILSSAYNWDERNTSAYKDIVSIGKSVKNIKLYIVDESGNEVKENETGEAWISGTQVFHSYLDENMNEDKFGLLQNEKCYKTGDLMFRNEEGNLFYCGRKDQQIKIQGKRVELGEIEYHAGQLATRFQPVAISYKGKFDSNQIALFIEKTINRNTLMENLQRNLPDYMIPTKIIGLDDLPLNKNQKVDKKVLASYIEKN